MTKLHLVALERKAKAVIETRGAFELRQWNATHASDTRRWREDQRQAAAVHIAANSPDVTLVLIARIRELVYALAELTSECEERSENQGGDWYGGQRELIAKGCVLP